MAVGKGSMARAAKAAAGKVKKNGKKPLEEQSLVENVEAEAEAAVQNVEKPAENKPKKSTRRRTCVKKNIEEKPKATVKNSIGIGEEMPVFYY